MKWQSIVYLVVIWLSVLVIHAIMGREQAVGYAAGCVVSGLLIGILGDFKS